MTLKQQSAIEFIVTYSLAILIIGLFVASVFILADNRPPIAYLGSSCSIQPLFPCTESLLTYNSFSAINPIQYYVVFNNELGSVIYFPVNSINITTINIGNSGISHFYGNCNPAFASQSSQVLCEVYISGAAKPNVGQQTNIAFTISYNICKTSNVLSCAPGLYRSSGSSSQTVAPASTNLYALQFLTNPSGTVIFNGETYFNGITIYEPTGNYVLFGSPAGGLGFMSWSISGSSVISNTMSQTTNLILISNAIVTANFG